MALVDFVLFKSDLKLILSINCLITCSVSGTLELTVVFVNDVAGHLLAA